MKRSLAALGMTLIGLSLPAAVSAHPLAPGLLELTEVAPARYAVLWRTSVARAGSASVEPRLPADCARLSQPQPRIESGEALVARWLVQCASGGLVGRTLSVDGLPGSGINVIVRVVALDQPEFKALLGADQPAVTVAPQSESVFVRYLQLGAGHLLGGFDHLLFLLGLFLLVGAGHARDAVRRLTVTVTAFTAGHSITLSLAVLGFVPLRPDLAELLIAATVLLLALALPKKGSGTFSGKKMHLTPFLAGGFGLVHGLGFAGALRGIGLPAQDIPLSLLGFNLGIELAQLALVALLLTAAWGWRRLPATPRWVPALPAYLIGSMAACWLLERTAVLLA